MKKHYLILLVILMTLLITEEAFACKCKEPNVGESFKKATVIFSGEVIKLDVLRATFKVQKIWKGSLAEEIIMQTGAAKVANGTYVTICGFSYSIGEKYLIYASGSEDNLRTSTCSRSKRLKDSEEDIEELEKLKVKNNKVEHTGYFDFNGKIINVIQNYQTFSCLINDPL